MSTKYEVIGINIDMAHIAKKSIRQNNNKRRGLHTERESFTLIKDEGVNREHSISQSNQRERLELLESTGSQLYNEERVRDFGEWVRGYEAQTSTHIDTTNVKNIGHRY